MSGPADHLLKLIYEWIEEASECSSNLRDLAKELESLRENCNAVETVSSTVAAATTVLSIFAAPFTGGASLAVGAVAGGLGAGVSAVTKLIEKVESSSKLERVKKIDKKCNKITSNINHYYNVLRGKYNETYSYYNPYSYIELEDEIDKYVMKELLKAMLRRSGLDAGLEEADLERFVTDIIKDALNTFTRSPFSVLLLDVIGVLSVFSLKLGGSLVCSLAAAGGVQIGKTVLAVGGKAAFLGLAALGFTLYESIKNWKELIKNKHETKASQSVRDIANKIKETKNSLSEKLSRTENIVKKEVSKLRFKRRKWKPESSSSSESSSDEEGDLKMALINSRSANKLFRPNDSTLSDLEAWSRSRKLLREAVLSKPRPRSETRPEAHPNMSKGLCLVTVLIICAAAFLYNSSILTFEATKSLDRPVAMAPAPPDPPQNEQSSKGSSLESSTELESSEDKEGVKMALINAQSANKCIKNTKHSPNTLIELLQNNALDVLLITETWFPLKSLFDSRVGSILPPNYSFLNEPRFFHNRESDFRGGGAIVYSNDLVVRRVYFTLFLDLPFEYTAATMSRQGSSESVLVLTIYRPPKNRKFLGDLRYLFSMVFAEYSNVIIAGDFNVLVNDLSKKETRDFLKLLEEFGLIQHVTNPTRGSNILDLVISSHDVPITDLSVQPNNFSDHDTVLFSTNFLHSASSSQKKPLKREKEEEREKENAKTSKHLKKIVKKEVNELQSKRRKIEPQSSSDEEGDLKMALINSRSANKLVRPNNSTLSDLIEDNDLDVLLITETWLPFNNLRRGEFRTILPENNTAISNPRFFRRGGGVAIVTRLNVTPFVFPYFPETFEYVAASVRRSEGDEPTFILNIYRPPEDNHAQFFDELRTLLCVVLRRYRRVVIAGDFNIWMDCPGERETRDFQTLLDDFGLRQHVSGPTHTAGRTLDLVITRPDVRVTDVSVQVNDPKLTDHSTVFFTVDVKRSDGTDNDVDDLIKGFGNMFC